MRFVFLAIVLLCCASCTDEQIARAHTVVAESDAQLARATEAERVAQQALETAKAGAAQINSEQATKVVAQAQGALDLVTKAHEVAATTNAAAHSALDAATKAQEAGASSVGVVGAAAGGLVPGLLAALGLGLKLLTYAKAYRQTVTGLDTAKEQLAADPALAKAWDTAIAPALDASHDASTRKLVATIQATNV